MSSKGWICKGVASDGQQHSNQNPQGKHEAYENFGNDCVMCGLKKEQVNGSKNKPPAKVIAGTAILGALFVFGLGAYNLLKDESTPISNDYSDTNNTTPSKSNSGKTIKSPVIKGFRTLSEVSSVPAMTTRYGGSTSFAPLRSEQIENTIEETHEGFKLTYTEPAPGEKPGSGKGIEMLIEGQLSFSQSSRSVKDKEFKRAKNRGFSLKQVPVAIDGIALYVKQDFPVPELTLSQVKDIFTGKITNWSELGGPNVDIKPFSRDPNDGGTPDFFQEKILQKESFGNSVEPYIRDTTTSIHQVVTTPGGISYATASEVCNQNMIKTVPLAKNRNQTYVSPCEGSKVNLEEFANNAYPLARRLFVVIKEDGNRDHQAGVAYANMLLSDEGQQLVKESGLVPLINKE
ncbi:hypothetical protein NIES267_09790 [Calothrix parasitica NIES-267]|uniref:PBP domain-containing protein n=1 Tax=Calothrix parasitica NIES-267 TaxID=1973488 RepID=A0A1Z4LJU3_9CYAN|nr:hypothetical protein NIES267_09790 [Calothrix parasitica NIES-267]